MNLYLLVRKEYAAAEWRQLLGAVVCAASEEEAHEVVISDADCNAPGPGMTRECWMDYDITKIGFCKSPHSALVKRIWMPRPAPAGKKSLC